MDLKLLNLHASSGVKKVDIDKDMSAWRGLNWLKPD